MCVFVYPRVFILSHCFGIITMLIIMVSSPFLAQVTTNITKCYSVAAQFEGCREKIQEVSAIIKDICRLLYYKVTFTIAFFSLQWQFFYSPLILKFLCMAIVLVWFTCGWSQICKLMQKICILTLVYPCTNCSKMAHLFKFRLITLSFLILPIKLYSRSIDFHNCCRPKTVVLA